MTEREHKKKSYGEESCSCGGTETTLDRVSLLCWREKKERSALSESMCMCVCGSVAIEKKTSCGVDCDFAKQN